MSASETPSLVLNFPIQLKETGDYTSDAEMIFQTKLAWIRPLNQAALGLCEISEEGKQAVRRFNELCRELGYPPLHIDF